MGILYLIGYYFLLLQDSSTEADQCQTSSEDVVEPSADSGPLQDGKTNEKGKDKEGKGKDKDDKEKNKDVEKEKGKEKDTDKKGDKDKEKVKGLDGTNLDTLLQRLPGCVSRDLIDQLTVCIMLYMRFYVPHTRFLSIT